MASKMLLWVTAPLLCMCSTLSAQEPPKPPPPTPPVQNPPPPGVIVTPTQPTAAQQAAAAAGKNVSNDQISDAIKKSGLSQDQLRDRLKSAGYDPGLSDPFFKSAAQPAGVAALPGSTATESVAAAASADFVKALSQLGILGPVGEVKLDETEKRSPDKVTPRASGVFGKSIFDRASTTFDPVTSGPVDPEYRLGVGDAIQVILTGQVELAYQLDVRRDGSVVIPQVGQVQVAGLTLDATRTLLKVRLGSSYSGLSSGEVRLDVSIARLRANAVFVIGEVEQPGAYQVNSLATLFQALARSGGPTARGSFRAVELRRAGKLLRTVDLYDYLLRGDASNDARLEQGDIIFVPLNRRAVAITGAVRRPAIFELKLGEGFGDLIEFAGGFLPSAALEIVQIDRVLPPAQRKPGFDRVRMDVRLHGRTDSLANVALNDDDIVNVLAIGDLRRNTVTIDGAVFQPGEFEFTVGMTLDSLILRAQGILPWALADRVKVQRQIPATARLESYSLDLSKAGDRAFKLSEFDAIVVLDGRLAYPSRTIAVTGAVMRPGERSFMEKESVQDAIDRAGGLREEAEFISLARRKYGPEYNDTTSVIFRFEIDAAKRAVESTATSFQLQPDDRIEVRSAPGYRNQRVVSVGGMFVRPGEYTIIENRERLSDVVRRAGGLLPGAFRGSFHLLRGGKLVGVEFDLAMRGSQVDDILLLAGDQLSIGPDQRTVFVTGEVSRPSLLPYRPGLSVSDYIELAGGPTDKGMMHRAIVDYQSGFSKRVHRYFGFISSEPTIESGAIITVPARPEDKGNSAQTWTQILAIVSTITSLVIAIVAVKRL